MIRTDADAQWFAVWTRSRHERSTAASLSSLGIQHYLPLKTEVRQWSDRKQAVASPLFPGYLFVFMNPAKDGTLNILKTPGVVSMVGNHHGPLPIPAEEIENIQTVLMASTECEVRPGLTEGDRVGVLSGVEGTLVRAKSVTQLLISISMIRQSIAINVSPDDVELVA
jgi:transcriptional antiterminator NusG